MIATNKLRWVERAVPIEPPVMSSIKVLQQWWVDTSMRNRNQGATEIADMYYGEWRDVPVELE